MASKENYRGAAAGLFLAGVVLAGGYYLQPTATGNEQNNELISESTFTSEEARELLQEEGFTTLSSEEYDQLTQEKEELSNEIATLTTQIEELEQSQVEGAPEESGNETEAEADAEEDTTTESDSDTEPEPVTINLAITSGMTTQQISEELERLGLVDEASTFENTIYDRDLEYRIQMGEFTLNSDMSLDEIVATLTSS